MSALEKALQEPKSSLNDFKNITIRLLDYIPNVISGVEIKGDYRICSSVIAGTEKFIRPINQNLFISESKCFIEKFDDFLQITQKLSENNTTWSEEEYFLIDSVLYTIQQSIGAGFDLLSNPNSARKLVGNRFEELMGCVFSIMGIANKKIVLQIPYETDEGNKVYKCENDLVISPFKTVKSASGYLDEKEVVVSVKTTSKDRMGKMFIDKMLLERFVGHPQKVIGIFLNDVQRKERDNISFTLVSGLFMVYTKFLSELEGVYYLDPPANAYKAPFNRHMKRFSKLITTDIWELLTP